MKKIVLLLLSLCVLISYASIPVSVHSEPEEMTRIPEQSEVSKSSFGIDANSSLLGSDLEIENVKAAFLYEHNSDSLLYAYNADEKMHPASLVKLFTAIVAISNGNLDDVVTVSKSAVESIPYDAVSENPLQPGEEILLRDLLYFMLVGSANDAAAVIAEHIGGNQVQFVQLMNQYALDIGCTGTQIINPHGLHNDGQYTTARDVARILNTALESETFLTIFKTTEYTLPATNMSAVRELSSRNSIMDPSSKLYYDSRVIGGRTGVAGDGRRCLASVAENNGMLAICVVMGSETVYQEDGYSAITVGSYKETSQLLNAGFDGYQAAQILYAGQSLRQCEVINGDADVILGPRVSVSTVLPKDVALSDLTFRYVDLPMQAPIKEGTKLSAVEIWHAGICLATADLYAMNAVTQHVSLLQTGDENKSGTGARYVWSVVILVGILFAVVFGVIKFRGKLKRIITLRKARKHRRNHRRSR